MYRHCPRCHKVTTEDSLLRCPSCQSLFDDPPVGEVMLNESQVEKLRRELRRWIVTWILGSFSVVGVPLMVLSLRDIYRAAVSLGTDYAKQRIEEQFRERSIRLIVEGVARREAEAKIIEHINPAINSFKAESGKAYDSFRSLVESRQAQIARDYSELRSSSTSLSQTIRSVDARTMDQVAKMNDLSAKLSSELKVLERAIGILRLGAETTAVGDRASFNALLVLEEDNDSSIRMLARGEIRRTKAFWVGVSSVRGASLVRQGKEIAAKEYTTCELVKDAKTNPDPRVRSIVTAELGGRKERIVPPLLIQLIERDPNLEVVKSAVQSYERLTGFVCPDVFGDPQVKDHWQKNSAVLLEKMATSACMP